MNTRITTKRTRATATEDRREQLRRGLETFDLIERHSPLDWPASQDLHAIAADLGVPYLMLLVMFYERIDPCVVSLADVDAFTADPLVREELGAWFARGEKAEVA